MTYKQAEEKIFDAYFKDEIKPLNMDYCVCGTLCNNTHDWYRFSGYKCSHGYSGDDFKRIENALLCNLTGSSYTEEELFNGICASLEVLKTIHKSKGEIIDEVPVFIKRTIFQNLK